MTHEKANWMPEKEFKKFVEARVESNKGRKQKKYPSPTRCPVCGYGVESHTLREKRECRRQIREEKAKTA